MHCVSDSLYCWNRHISCKGGRIIIFRDRIQIMNSDGEDEKIQLAKSLPSAFMADVKLGRFDL